MKRPSVAESESAWTTRQSVQAASPCSAVPSSGSLTGTL